MFLCSLVARDTGVPSAAPLLRGYAKVEPITLSELNNFVVTAPSQEIDFLCTGRVSRVGTEKGWCYVACSKCSRKFQRSVSAFACVRCNNSHAVGALRYRVELTVVDDTADGTFVCFDGVMTKLHNLRASDADSELPPFIVAMEGKTYTFQVRVTSYNFTDHHQTFTVSRIIEEVERVPAPDSGDNGGGDDDDDNAPDGKPADGDVAGGGGGCEASKNGKEPAGYGHGEPVN
ncbi:hypothetical protein N665_0054s0038 [Sinapis alba]|nr:hypothetical protein N665_0054s0038 [Sinapis alba]